MVRLFAFLVGFAPLLAAAELRLPRVFADGMVLQRDRANPIWGWDDAGAKAVIDGDTVVLSHPDLSRPAWARFGWSETAIPNLINAVGQPVSLFRTDDLAPE